MDTPKTNSDSFDEVRSLDVIRDMIQVSRKKIKNDGILFIVWGYAMAFSYLSSYLKRYFVHPSGASPNRKDHKSWIGTFAIVFTLFYVLKQRKRVTTYIGLSLRYVWLALFASMMLINLILFNVLHEVNFALQHPVFMVNIAFALVVTGIILRYNLIIAGGIIFGLLAYVCSFFALRDQQLFDGIAWIIAFVIPGHWMYYKRN